MDPRLPDRLQAALTALTEGRSGRDLGVRAAEISRLYRSGKSSGRAVSDEADALAYALTRMPATYAAVRAALDALVERAPDFSPASLLDLGSGPGTAAWAAVETFDTLAAARLIDASRPFLDLSEALAPDEPALANAERILTDLASPQAVADLVVLAYALTELPPARVEAAAEAAWAATSGALLIVEPGTPAAWARLMAVRARLLELGAIVAAPCPHHAPCPLTPPDWCHFSQRLPRLKAHIAAKGASAPFEDEKYAYLALVRPGVALEVPRPRVLAPPVETKAELALKLCEPHGALAVARIPRRDKAAYRAVRRADWGDTTGRGD